MTARVIAFSLFILAVFGISILESRCKAPPQTAGYIALRNLVKNTRINSTLWTFQKGETPVASWGMPKPEGLIGRYARHDILQGKPITAEALSDLPQLTLDDDKVRLTYNLNVLGPLGSYLNAGAKACVCEQENSACTGGPYDVEALIGKVDSQLVLIDVTNIQAVELRKIKKPTLRIAAQCN
jgi:hypothetical protein